MLINRHELPAQMAIDLAAGARERATIDLVEQAGRTNDMPRFVSQLNLEWSIDPLSDHASACASGICHLSSIPWPNCRACRIREPG